MESQDDGIHDTGSYLSDQSISSRALVLSTAGGHLPEDDDASTTPKQVLQATGSESQACCQLSGNVAVHAEQDVHIGQEVHVGYKYTSVHHNRAEQIISCDKFVSKQYVSPMSTEDTPSFRHIRDQTKAELNANQRLFVETRSFHQAVDAINKRGLMLISGPPGSGKSMITRAVLHYFEGRGFTPLIVQSIREWRQHVRSDLQLIILLEHEFGEMFFKSKKFEEAAKCFRPMLEFAKSHMCLTVFTAYPHITREIQDYDIKDNIFKSILKISLHQTVLSAEEKQEMIKKHGFTKDTTLCRHIMKRDICGPVFPGCLKKFRENSFNVQVSISIFQKPALSYVSLLSRSLKHRTHGGCLAAALLLLLKPSQESENIEDSIQDSLKDFKWCRVQCVVTLMSSLWQLFGHFQKPSCSDRQINMAAVLALASSEFRDVFLRVCDIRFLVEYVDTDVLVRSPNDASFHHRIYDEIMLGHLQEVCQHQLMQNEKYLQEFMQFCSKNRLPLHNLFTVTDPEHKEPMLYWSGFCLSSVLSMWCVSQMLACGTEAELVSVCLQRVLLVSALSGDQPSSKKVRKIVSIMRKLPTVPVPLEKMMFPFPKNVSKLKSRCEYLRKHGSYHLHFFLKGGWCFPYDGVRVFINEVHGYLRLEMTEFHWNLVLRRVQADHAIGLHEQDSEGNTYLHLAAKYRNHEAVRFAVKRGASVTLRNKDGLMPPNLAQNRLQHSQGKFTQRDLHIACQDGNLTQVKKLLCLDATVSCVDQSGKTPLHSACKAGQLSIASLLLELGADIDAKAVDGLTPLHEACSWGYQETTSFLLQQGADPNIADTYGTRPLHIAVKHNMRYIILLLLNAGADIDAKTVGGYTSLHIACSAGNKNTVKQLLEENAKLNVRNKTGQTPLHLAVQGNFTDIVWLLCHCGANTNLKDKAGLTPLKKGRVYALLLKYKAEGVGDAVSEFSFPDVVETGSSAVSEFSGRGNISSNSEIHSY